MHANMEFTRSLVDIYHFSETDLKETMKRFRPERIPAKSLFAEKGKVADREQIARDVEEMKYNDLMNQAIQLQTLSASERYQLFCEKHNDILQKVALKHVASYLGIDIATLSRIRKYL